MNSDRQTAGKAKGRNRAGRSRKPAATSREYRERKTVAELGYSCQQAGCDKPVLYFDPDYMPDRLASTLTGLICGTDHKPGPRAQAVLIKDSSQALSVVV